MRVRRVLRVYNRPAPRTCAAALPRSAMSASPNQTALVEGCSVRAVRAACRVAARCRRKAFTQSDHEHREYPRTA